MLSFKRALTAAAIFITLFYLLTRSHAPVPPSIAIQQAYPNTDNLPDSLKQSESTTSTPKTGGKTASNGAAGGAGAAAGQKALQDMSKMSTYEKLAYQYPYDVESKFPAYIWQTWKYTPADGKFVFRGEEASWTQHHPGFIHEVITDDVAENLIKLFYASIPEVLEAYDAMPLPVLKADFFRYLILLARGGVYSDIDTSALKSAVEWVPDSVPRDTIGLVIGIEADPDRPDWHEWYSRRIQFCQWTIQSKPGHPVLRDVVARITAETLRLKRSGSLAGFQDKNVIEFTGPAIWTDTIFEYFNDPRYFDMSTSKGQIDWQNFTGMVTAKKVGDVIVLPITSFSPGVQQMGAQDVDDPMAFVSHGFQGTWKPENERHIGG
ncbi:Initiation-specific alpha-1,6-mannosyltransferase [Cytospora mali]|uniref:Initiation-specific alpha-1,6-mannosyltransferase n=1 Tax=Cytospora mali TaxID=578113 RepID=A0A194WA39_CYTMA|nr:Initiation-specific alpha-1,6-mannosyltransferase [Valsa mali]